ncbi:MAG: WD40 repeat domain-containing protein [Planctomycetota bacterium]
MDKTRLVAARPIISRSQRLGAKALVLLAALTAVSMAGCATCAAIRLDHAEIRDIWAVGADEFAILGSDDVLRFYDVSAPRTTRLITTVHVGDYFVCPADEDQLVYIRQRSLRVRNPRGEESFSFPFLLKDHSGPNAMNGQGLIAWLEYADPNSGDFLVRLADCTTGSMLLDMRIERPGYEKTDWPIFAVSRDRTKLALGDHGGDMLRVINLENGELLWSDEGYSTFDLAFSDKQETLYASRGSLIEYEAGTGARRKEWPRGKRLEVVAPAWWASELQTVERNFGRIALSPDGRLLAVGTIDGAIIYDLLSARHIATASYQPWPVKFVRFSANSKGLWAFDGRAGELKYFAVGKQ